MADEVPWITVKESNGTDRVPLSDRVIRGFITSKNRDLQGEVVDPSVWKDVVNDGKKDMSRLEWAVTYGVMGFQHGMTPDGSPPEILSMGKFHKYRKIGDKIEVEGSIPKGSPSMDEVWNTVKEHALNAGFSIGGKALEKAHCDANGQNCTLVKADVLEVSWCVEPANTDAVITDVKMVKSDDNVPLLPMAFNRLFSCQPCDDHVTDLIRKGMTASKAIIKYSTILEADPPTPGSIGGTSMAETQTAAPVPPVPVISKEFPDKKKDEDKKEEDKKDDEKKAMAVRIEELTKMIMDLTDKVNKTQTPAPVETAKAAVPETKPVFAETEAQAIEKLVKSGKQIVGYSTGAPDGNATVAKTEESKDVFVAAAKRIIPK